ncbi:MAG: hypothetical protein FWF87_06560 [Synergistaceae bacterium]|nr:hypothetical protein [Synergistaceae bacterium]
MTWGDICKIASLVFASSGGIGVVFVCFVKLAGNTIAERLQKKYELKLNKELEKYIATLDKKNYISKARFDKEFIIYQELSEKVYYMVGDNTELFKVFDSVPKEEDERKIFYDKRCIPTGCKKLMTTLSTKRCIPTGC